MAPKPYPDEQDGFFAGATVPNPISLISAGANSGLLDIWYTPAFQLNVLKPRMPMVYADLCEGGLVVVGLNPSFSDKAFSSFLAATPLHPFDHSAFYAWRDRREDYDVITAAEVERLSLSYYSDYFGPFASLANHLGVRWQHVDLFGVRETDDDKAMGWVSSRRSGRVDGFEDLNAFGLAQVTWCRDVLNSMKPDAVLVANSRAARILQGAWSAPFDDQCGHRWLQLGGRRVPVFMSGSWKYMDVFVSELMRWHLARTLARTRPSEG